MRCATVALLLVVAAAFGFTQDKGAADKPVAPTLPTKTPFDSDATKREGYLHCFAKGFEWAQGIHVSCPITPLPENMHAVRGWIEGWQAGVAAVGERVEGGLPARYATYVAWKEPPADNAPSPAAPPKAPR